VTLDERGKAAGVRACSLHPRTIVGAGLAKHLPVEELRARGVIDEHGTPCMM